MGHPYRQNARIDFQGTAHSKTSATFPSWKDMWALHIRTFRFRRLGLSIKNTWQAIPKGWNSRRVTIEQKSYWKSKVWCFDKSAVGKTDRQIGTMLVGRNQLRLANVVYCCSIEDFSLIVQNNRKHKLLLITWSPENCHASRPSGLSENFWWCSFN